MKYGNPLHIALHNKDFKSAVKILKKLKKSEFFNPDLDLNKVDEDGNNPLHILMRIFNDDVENSRKLANALLQMGCSIQTRNKHSNTPLI